MKLPFGLSFSKARLRELSDEALHTHTRRYLQAMIANPPAPTGSVDTCINSTEAVVRAGVVAKATMEEKLGATYTNFVVHTLECQVTGSGMIYKAAVSGEHPITGSRDWAHVTYLNFMEGKSLDPSYDPEVLLGVSPNGAFSGEEEDSIGAGGEVVTKGDGKESLSSPSSRLLHTTMPQQHHRRMQTTSSGITYTVLDASVITGTPPATGDTSFTTAITNQDALKDPLVELLGFKTSAALVLTAIIIVGSFLLALLIFIVYYVCTHWHIMSHLRQNFHSHTSIMSHLREHWHIHERIKDLFHHHVKADHHVVEEQVIDTQAASQSSASTLPEALATTPALVLKDTSPLSPLSSSAPTASPATTSTSSSVPAAITEAIY